MLLTDGQRRLIQVAGFLGLIQGLAWSVMSLISLVIYFTSSPYRLNPNSPYFLNYGYMSAVNDELYSFLTGGLSFSGRIMSGPLIVFWLFVYLGTSMIWTVLSSIVALKKMGNLALPYKSWSILTALISTIDFVVVLLLGITYDNCLDYLWGRISYSTFIWEGICANGILPVMVVAARGFVLWFVNLAVAWELFKLSKEIRLGHFVGTSTTNNVTYQAPQPLQYMFVGNTPQLQQPVALYPQGFSQYPQQTVGPFSVPLVSQNWNGQPSGYQQPNYPKSDN